MKERTEQIHRLDKAAQGKRLPENVKLPENMVLQSDEKGLALVSGDQVLRGDFVRMLPRLKQNNLSKELLVRAAKIKSAKGALRAIDATAGLGEDALLLAAAGFHVTLYEKNPIIYQLLDDAMKRAAEVPQLAVIVSRMELLEGDSVCTMKELAASPDVILLDPMFPERQKSALVRKKLQIIQKLELPCGDEAELLAAAMEAQPRKVVIKRPPKGPYLAGVKPDYSLTGKAVRFDCIVSQKPLSAWVSHRLPDCVNVKDLQSDAADR